MIGAESLSWRIVRDLAARLPAMILPRWLASRSQPIAIDDVTFAIERALELPSKGRSLRLARPRDLAAREDPHPDRSPPGTRPVMLDVPVLTPRLSSYWLKLVTGADYQVARQLIEGLSHDLLASQPEFSALVPRARSPRLRRSSAPRLGSGRPASRLQSRGCRSSGGQGLTSCTMNVLDSAPCPSSARAFSKSYGPRTLFSRISMTVGRRSRRAPRGEWSWQVDPCCTILPATRPRTRDVDRRRGARILYLSESRCSTNATPRQIVEQGLADWHAATPPYTSIIDRARSGGRTTIAMALVTEQAESPR